MLNQIALVGRLTRDPELRATGAGRPVCDLRLAVDGRGEQDACFVDVITFDGSAEACARYLAKGRLVAIEGRLAYDQWEAPDGEKRSRHKVIGRVQFLPSGSRTDETTEPAIEEPASF